MHGYARIIGGMLQQPLPAMGYVPSFVTMIALLIIIFYLVLLASKTTSARLTRILLSLGHFFLLFSILMLIPGIAEVSCSSSAIIYVSDQLLALCSQGKLTGRKPDLPHEQKRQ